MSLANTTRSYGRIARVLHWLTAGLILIALPLGVIANDLPYDTSDQLLRKAQLFSLHKTLGIAAFFTGLARILWALTQPHPQPLHPERRFETFVAGAVHWMLYIALLAVPLTGWVHHAATTAFAPILWPFGQGLPFVPTSETIAHGAAALHGVFTKLLAASVILHVAGALKHHLIDRDATLRRMVSGLAAPTDGAQATVKPRAAALTALVIFIAGGGLALWLGTGQGQPSGSAPTTAQTAIENGGNWQVAEGTLGLTVQQLGAPVSGQFETWQAEIRFDDRATPPTGQTRVRIDMTSLRLGSVTTQAQGADFLDTAAHSDAVFEAAIAPDGTGYVAEGTLTLRGITHPLRLPFTLAIDGDQARMTGSAVLDRRDFGIGASYGDEATVGFAVTLDIALTATRVTP
ncbi:cytochrome b/b6 domain-containing protein [Szabonella alba]|uniref:Cytochrome b/b6 domain-containing protein n=1 Tax=Szabonella alba TaxID=2804194 RepID=A0A8K0VDM5_9RHOB|nr:cytochrome b/b6 domain-containing protein [Szabonella alba]MBL4918268.1 cytochrome b/b6 domain-containing protein [Szabonella alba]